MKAISLWQPWATAIAVGVKNYETRSWSTSYRGSIAIHAAKKQTRDLKEFFDLKCRSGANLHPFRDAGYHSFVMLPFGAIVATADLVSCDRTEDLILGYKIVSLEEQWGNYDQGRFGWRLENVKALPSPLFVRGAQGFFNVDL